MSVWIWWNEPELYYSNFIGLCHIVLIPYSLLQVGNSEKWLEILNQKVDTFGGW